MGSSVFLAAFLGATMGALALSIFRITIVTPVLHSVRKRLKAYLKTHRITPAEVVATSAGLNGKPTMVECTCCQCGETHTAPVDDNGKVIWQGDD